MSESPPPFDPSHRLTDYDFLAVLGTGSFATVWLAQHRLTRLKVAIKIIQRQSLESEETLTRFAREISLLKQMNHPFIAELFEVIEDRSAYYLVMELVENGNLLDYVNTQGRLREDQARCYFCELISALDYLHTTRFVAHRDLKAENVLLDRYNNIRLIDFGLSKEFSNEASTLQTACGSPAYAAPEMIQGHSYTKAADMWSAGVLLFAIVAGHLPFDDDNIQRLLQKIVYTEVKYPAFMSPQLVDLLQKMICKDPERRIALDGIKGHPWFSQSEYIALLGESKSDTGGQDAAIEKDIIDQMTQLGIDCHDLHQALLVGDFTELTALYRIFRRQTSTERLKDVMQRIGQQAANRAKAAGTAAHPPVGPGPRGRPAPFPAVGGTTRVLASPVAAGTAGRRGSRPVAVRPNVAMPGTKAGAAGAHEA
jgi:serine/threonine protein kinase